MIDNIDISTRGKLEHSTQIVHYHIAHTQWDWYVKYRQVSNIRRTKSQHLKDSRIVLRLSLPNPLKPDVKSRMKM